MYNISGNLLNKVAYGYWLKMQVIIYGLSSFVNNIYQTCLVLKSINDSCMQKREQKFVWLNLQLLCLLELSRKNHLHQPMCHQYRAMTYNCHKPGQSRAELHNLEWCYYWRKKHHHLMCVINEELLSQPSSVQLRAMQFKLGGYYNRKITHHHQPPHH